MDASPLKTANKDRTLATETPALDNPHLPKNHDFGGKTEAQKKHMLGCAFVYHAAAWYHDHGGIDSVAHQLDAPTLMRLCYDEGGFNAWITGRLENEAIYEKSSLPMLQGTPGQNQAARSTIYTIRSKYPHLHAMHLLKELLVSFFLQRPVLDSK